ncbi:MAG: hypothetical protein OHK0013_23610 [Sandaracinaceae bacterium]
MPTVSPPPGARHAPLGAGVTLVRLAVAPADVVVLRGILAGYDGLVSVHGDDAGSADASTIVALVTPDGLLVELEALLDEIAREIPLRRLPDDATPTTPIDRGREAT